MKFSSVVALTALASASAQELILDDIPQTNAAAQVDSDCAAYIAKEKEIYRGTLANMRANLEAAESTEDYQALMTEMMPEWKMEKAEMQHPKEQRGEAKHWAHHEDEDNSSGDDDSDDEDSGSDDDSDDHSGSDDDEHRGKSRRQGGHRRGLLSRENRKGGGAKLGGFLPMGDAVQHGENHGDHPEGRHREQGDHPEHHGEGERREHPHHGGERPEHHRGERSEHHGERPEHGGDWDKKGHHGEWDKKGHGMYGWGKHGMGEDWMTKKIETHGVPEHCVEVFKKEVGAMKGALIGVAHQNMKLTHEFMGMEEGEHPKMMMGGGHPMMGPFGQKPKWEGKHDWHKEGDDRHDWHNELRGFWGEISDVGRDWHNMWQDEQSMWQGDDWDMRWMQPEHELTDVEAAGDYYNYEDVPVMMAPMMFGGGFGRWGEQPYYQQQFGHADEQPPQQFGHWNEQPHQQFGGFGHWNEQPHQQQQFGHMDEKPHHQQFGHMDEQPHQVEELSKEDKAMVALERLYEFFNNPESMAKFEASSAEEKSLKIDGISARLETIAERMDSVELMENSDFEEFFSEISTYVEFFREELEPAYVSDAVPEAETMEVSQEEADAVDTAFEMPTDLSSFSEMPTGDFMYGQVSPNSGLVTRKYIGR